MSNDRKVKVNSILIGKSFPSNKYAEESSNEYTLELIKNQIFNQFGYDRNCIVADEDIVSTNNKNYPQFYAAGWFVSEKPITGTDGKGSELVVVAHGDTIKDAQYYMMRAIESTNWDRWAKNI